MTTKEQANTYYIANIRHELRTPINAIIGYSEMLIEDLEDQESELVCELSKITGDGRELLSIINSIVEPVSNDTEEWLIKLKALFARIETEVTPPLEQILHNCQILLDKTDDDNISSDITRIQTAGTNLQNLVNNIVNLKEISSLEHLQEETISTKLTEIPQVDSNIVSDESKDDSLNLSHGNITVLVVDDNENNRELLARHLHRQGYQVIKANNGKQALEKVKEGNCDLILLDFMMPELDGYQVLEQLKSNSQWQHIPVIMISALDEFDNIVNCIEIGAEDFLPKPFNPTLLKARIGASLEKKLLRDREREYLQKVEEYSAKMDKELEIGRNMQLNFLPPRLLNLSGWEFASFFKPARQVAGDFYDLFKLPNDHIVVVVADVCDKGVGAALFMALFRSLIRIFSVDNQLADQIETLFATSPPPKNGWLGDSHTNLAHFQALQAVSRTNNYVADNHGDLGMFATMFVAILEPNTGLLSYINGGHEPLFIISPQGEIIKQLNSTSPAVGMLPEINFHLQQLYLQPGEILFGYTDGVPEARSQSREFFTEKRLEKLVSQPNSSAVKTVNYVSEKLLEYMGDADQFDDITMLAVQRL